MNTCFKDDFFANSEQYEVENILIFLNAKPSYDIEIVFHSERHFNLIIYSVEVELTKQDRFCVI